MSQNWCKVTIILCVIGILGASSARADLRITEILSAPATDWDGDGSVDTKLDEWVEVTNTGAASVELQDVFLRDGTGTAWHFGFTGSLEPGGVLLITGSLSVQWQADNSAGTSGLSLNNSGDLVELWRAPEGGTEVLLDSVSVPGHAAAADRALAWLESLGSWILHDALSPYGGDLVPTGTGCAPSPGEVNACASAVPVEGASVGKLKAVWDD